MASSDSAPANPDQSASTIADQFSARVARIAEHCRAYQGPQLSRSVRQALLSAALYAVAIALMFFLVKAGYWYAALALAPVSGLLLVKLFTIQHDCGHGSYFKARQANNIIGWLISILTFTPYGFWRDSHNRHHAGSGNLDRRGLGAVDMLTVEEFKRLSPKQRFLYRFYRHPLTLLVFGPPFYFILMQRLPLNKTLPFMETYTSMKLSQIWKSVALLDLAIIVFYGALALWLGFGAVALVILPSVAVASWVGAWLFYVQHQYENAYWAKSKDWNYEEAALLGSSHYDLPKPIQWVTGNIGLHHIHHLCSLIPNYRLQECYDASEDLKAWPKMSFLDSLKTTRLALWDEARQRMISFRMARRAA
ncbi:MAG: fatty acid desaturase [Pseudomonadota bacterium]